MVTIKIQSIDYIIAAYLKGLGFTDDGAHKIVPALKGKLSLSQENGDKVIDELDKIIATEAKKIFNDSSLDDEQLVALFKFCVLETKGAQKWGDKIFALKDSDEKIVLSLRQAVIHVAPNYVFSQMKPQEITIPNPSNFLKKIFKHKKS